MRIGYARVSTSSQSFDRQLDALKSAGCERIFTDQASGAKSARPGLDRALEDLRQGDDLVVHSLDRLGRNMRHLLEVGKELHDRGINLISLHENVDTDTATGKLFFHVFGALAEFERALLMERVNHGLQAARARGRVGGRPKKLSLEKRKHVVSLYREGEKSLNEISRLFDISPRTVYLYLDELDPSRSSGKQA